MVKNYNPNLQLLLQKMFDNEKALDRILLTNDMHELYIICLSIQEGYSFEEFSEFFDDLVSACTEEISVLDELKEEQLENVSGGVSNLNKLTATALASLTAFMSVPVYGLDNAGNKPVASAGSLVSSDGKVDDQELRPLDDTAAESKTDKKIGVGEKISKAFDKITDSIWNNKGKILAISGALVAAGGWLVYKNKKIGDAIDNRREYKKDIKNIEEKLKEKKKDLSKVAGDLSAYGKKTKQRKLQDNINKRQRLNYEIKDLETRKKDKGENTGIGGIVKTALPGALVTAASTIPAGAKWILEKLGKLHDPIDTINKLNQAQKDLMERYLAIKAYVDKLNKEAKIDPYDADAGERKLDLALKDQVKGQEKAKMQVKNFFSAVRSHRGYDEKGVETASGAYVAVFNGPSGTGKTFTAQLLTACLTNVEPYIISAASLKAQKEKNTSPYYSPSYATLLMTSEQKDAKGEKNNGFYGLANYVQEHPKQGVVIIDEYDKLFDKDTGKNHPLDEFMRTVMDNGIMDDGQTKVDVSGTVFILTTNETQASLEGRVENFDGKLQEVTGVDKEGNKIYGTPKTDPSGTQTLVAHDASLMKRFKGKICTFDALSKDDYIDIAKQYLGDDKKKTLNDVQEEGGTAKATLCERLYWGFDSVEIDDKSYEIVAEYASKQDSAVRSIVGTGDGTGSVKGNYRAALTSKIREIRNKGGSVKKAKFKATAHIEQDSTGNDTVGFDIAFTGYAD